jgi:hypothetical protein
MGYYYDWIEQRWQPRQHRQLSAAERERQARRGRLLRGLLAEISDDDGLSQLYAALLARHWIGGDEELMRSFGKQVAALSHEGAH